MFDKLEPNTDKFFVHKNGRVPLLTTSNYKAWSVAIRHILESVSCWEIVKGTEQEPPEPGNNASTAVQNKYQSYQTRKSKAALLLYSSCSTDLQGYLNDIWDPNTIWQTLSNQADESQQWGGPIYLRRQLQSESYDTNTPISNYISKILSYRDKLAHTPQRLSKDEVIAYILIGLPESWNVISTVIENQPIETQTLDNIVNTLTSFEKWQALRAQKPVPTTVSTIAPTDSVSLISKKKFNKGRRPKEDKDSEEDSEEEIEYWYCTKKGHLENDCRIKIMATRKRRRRERKEQRRANFAPTVIDATVL
jgi:hypothetical protein